MSGMSSRLGRIEVLLLFAVLVAFVGVVWTISNKLERRDAALSIAWPRLPIPENGRIVTLQHSPEDIDRFVIQEHNHPSIKAREKLLIASQVDIYYEVLLTFDEEGNENCSKHFVILEATNSYTGLYHGLMDRMHTELGFCVLVFDWRSHGRSEDSPGDLTSELFMLDAAAMIERVFPNQAVHVFGWSLGGLVGFQLAIYKPQLVKSLVVYGSTSCFGPIPEGQTECVDHWSLGKVVFSSAPIMRLLGLQAEAELARMFAKLKTPFSKLVQQYWYSLRMDQKVKTPRVWLQIQGAKTFSQLDRIVCPFQQLGGEHEGLVSGSTAYSMELEASRIAKAEPPIVLEDPAGEGYSHFAIFEEGGLDLIVGHLKAFYDKHS